MNKDETRQNYLEAIHILNKQKGNVRAIDICEYLGFSRPTVSVAIRQLKEEGYIDIVDNFIALRNKGLKEAEMIYERHEILAHILMDLGVDEEIAYQDACKVEHYLSKESFAAIKEAYKSHK